MIIKKVKVYAAIIIMSFVFILFYQISFNIVLESCIFMFSDSKFLNMIVNIYFIFFLGSVLSSSGHLSSIADLLLKIFPARVAVTLLPMIMGFFPMPGGALFTVNFVKAIGEEKNFDKNVSAFANYWFRHVWEFIYPVYPGFILYYSLTDQNILSVVKNQYPLTLLMIVSGFLVIYFNQKDNNNIKKQNLFINSCVLIKKLGFVFFIFLFILLSLPVYYALIICIFFISVKYRLSIDNLKKSALKAINVNIFLTLWSVYLFQNVIARSELSNIILNTAQNSDYAIPVLIVVFPFILGYITGLTTSFVGICFPVLLPLFKNDIDYAVVTYASGFAGVLITPVHLCMSMTVDVLKAEYSRLFKMLFIPSLAVMLGGLLYMLK